MSRQKRPATHKQIQIEVGERIKWAREAVEPNRAAFARDLGLDRTTVQKIEDGDRPPSIFNVLDFSHALRISPNYILLGSMRDIDGELAALLGARHPELAEDKKPDPDSLGTASDGGTDRRPRKRRSTP